MSGLERLTAAIYHERQQKGSMLCAQHALNSLLQGNYFTPPDLAQIAMRLDALEQQYDDERRGKASTNMDDTGFFSVQVLEEALKVWGLTLARWRSERFLHLHATPHTQLAFILNLDQHWFTLRRFGPAEADYDFDEGVGYWYNLNSFLDAPEWVGRTYLGMVLDQAEKEGYSVFAVVQINTDEPLALPRTDADRLAMTIHVNPSVGGSTLSTARTLRQSADPSAAVAGLEDEDLELQAALQASLTAGTGGVPDFNFGASSSSIPPPPTRTAPAPPRSAYAAPVRNNLFDFPAVGPLFHGPPIVESDNDGEEDLVAASRKRGQEALERARRQQEVALREGVQYQAELDALAPRRRRAGEDEEEEMMRQAIEESKRMAEEQERKEKQAKEKKESKDEEEDEEDDPDYMDIDDGEDDLIAARHHAAMARQRREAEAIAALKAPRPSSASASSSRQPASLLRDPLYRPDFGGPKPTRYLDDEDAELQAALKASLEEGHQLTIPEPGTVSRAETRSAAATPPVPAQAPAPVSASASKAPAQASEEDDDEDDDEEQGGSAKVAEEKPLTAEELRKARLARFGG